MAKKYLESSPRPTNGLQMDCRRSDNSSLMKKNIRVGWSKADHDVCNYQTGLAIALRIRRGPWKSPPTPLEIDHDQSGYRIRAGSKKRACELSVSVVEEYA